MSDTPFIPYANEADVLQVGELSLENRLDRIVVFGSLEITRDLGGLQVATALCDQLAAVVATLRAEQADGRLPHKVAGPAPDELVPNPFEPR